MTIIPLIMLQCGKLKMQLDVEMSPPANNVWHLNSQGSSTALGKLTDIASPSQVSNFATRGASVASFYRCPLLVFVWLVFFQNAPLNALNCGEVSDS